jgi:hypothetical protein
MAFSSYAIVISKVNNLDADGDRVILGEWRLFGTRERGQSTLHDGSLTLTKNLTVPRIGPALNGAWASQTPRRDHLVVEYDTSTYLHNNKAIDSSGNERHAAYNDGATYSPAQGAFTFDGTDDYIKVDDIGNPNSGAYVHSASFWVKPDNMSSDVILMQIGKGANSPYKRLQVYMDTSNEITFGINSANTRFASTGISAGSWFHIAYSYDGGLTGPSSTAYKLYVNGVSITGPTSGTNEKALNLDANAVLAIGTDHLAAGDFFDGSISNFKLYDVVLTAEEVKRLYEMGRNGPGNYMNIVDTAVAIGRHAPQAQLDVSGFIRANGSNTNFTGQHRCSSAQGPLEKGLVVSASKNTYRNITGGLSTGAKAITIDESLPVVSLSNVAQDKACFGVVSRMEEANTLTRSETVGGLISEDSKVLGDNRVIVNSVGEGAIWVCDANGPLESGDYITTSNVAGYGMAQSDDLLHNYTVAKITMDCDFTASNVAVQAIKKVETLKTVTEDVWEGLSAYDRDETSETQYSNTLSPADYSNLSVDAQVGYVAQTSTTIVDYTDGSNVISVSEWSNLETNVQETYTSNTLTEIVDYTKFIDVGAWSNLEANVQNTYAEAEVFTYYRVQRGENVLDEHGMLQWEDTGVTEPGYEVRYLDASGAQTDEANCVYRAAFVGCTYHCG